MSWYKEFNFLISRNVYYFLISINRILDMKIYIYLYQEFEFLILRNHFLISRNRILDIKKHLLFLDIKKSNSWYQKDFFSSKYISWYQEFNYIIWEITSCYFNFYKVIPGWDGQNIVSQVWWTWKLKIYLSKVLTGHFFILHKTPTKKKKRVASAMKIIRLWRFLLKTAKNKIRLEEFS